MNVSRGPPSWPGSPCAQQDFLVIERGVRQISTEGRESKQRKQEEKQPRWTAKECAPQFCTHFGPFSPARYAHEKSEVIECTPRAGLCQSRQRRKAMGDTETNWEAHFLLPQFVLSSALGFPCHGVLELAISKIVSNLNPLAVFAPSWRFPVSRRRRKRK